MLLQSVPLLTVSASTTPPGSTGDWTINSNEVAHVSSQVLVQGDVDVYGTLVIDSFGLYLWGANDWDREIRIYDGGRVEVYNNSLISSYTSTCFNFEVEYGGELKIEGGTIQRSCAVSIQTADEVTLKNTFIEEGRMVFEIGQLCDYSLDWNIDGLTISNNTNKYIGTTSNLEHVTAIFFENWMPSCDGLYFNGYMPEFQDVNLINLCQRCVGIAKNTDWNSDLLINGMSAYNLDNSLNYSNYLSSAHGGGANWYPIIFSDYDGAGIEELIIRNASIYNTPHTVAATEEGVNLTLDNLTAWNLVNPNGDDQIIDHNLGSYNACVSFFSCNWFPPTLSDGDSLYGYNGASGTNGLELIRVDAKLTITNSNISDVWNGIEYWDNVSSPFYNGLRSQCIIIDALNVDAENISISETCNMHVGTSIYEVHNGRESAGSNNQDQACGYWSNDNASDYYIHPLGYYHYNTYHQCSEFVGVSIRAQSLNLTNSEIFENNKNIMEFTYASSTSYHYGIVRSHGILLTTTQVNQPGNLIIESVRLENNTRGGIMDDYTSTNNMMIQINTELMIDQSEFSNEYYEITNSQILTSNCLNGTNWNSGVIRLCRPIYLDGPTLTVTSTGYRMYQGDEDIVSGEVIRKWDLEVWVTDPDLQWTPNAEVSVTESNNWFVGNQSTGPNGGSTSFLVKEYSRSTTSRYDYTPHTVEVTMTNYSNSTSVSVTEDMSVVVYDPTPDAFPGDITQDWDTDGDGYGDNISGNNPDIFPNDSGQWNDTDGDGWGDNYAFSIDTSTGLRNQNNGDAFPNDASQWSDVDGDGYGDNYTFIVDTHNNLRTQFGDAFTTDSTQYSDIDGDGYGDNQSGNNPDEFIYDGTQWADSDGDGYGDNYTWVYNLSTSLRDSQNGDAFINEPTQWSDIDGDGYGDNSTGVNPDIFPLDGTQWVDADGDGLGDNQSGNNPDPYLNDSDNDGYNNTVDLFPWNPTQWEDNDNDGLGDNQSGTAADPYLNDTDNDGYNNTIDDFPFDNTQWEDADNDGYGDNLSGNNPDPSLDDSDNDGVNNSADDFPWNPTQTTDSDGDGYGDNISGYPADEFPNDPSQWTDSDGDGHGDNAYGNSGDHFPNDSTQWADSDGDGYGDNQSGNNPDEFPSDPTQWADSDGDGFGDNMSGNNPDLFPTEPTQWADSDGDGYGDNPLGGYPADAFPNDSSQWVDTDGDGYGDNMSGNNPDLFPSDSTQWADSDGDGFGDNPLGSTPDWAPSDATQWADSDGDGYGDNEYGTLGDIFPYDSTQWSDSDGDGFGDNMSGNDPDLYPSDPTQWSDLDGDGIGDNYYYDVSQTPTGLSQTYLRENQRGDAFPLDSTQWSDRDGDGYGDNQSGNNPDWAPMDHTQWIDEDNDGYGDNPLGTNPDPTPGDGDNDGFRDSEDAFPQDPLEAFDTDNDGIGDNTDTDDDNDGWTDAQEIDCQTSPYDSTSTPLDIDLDSICNWLDDDDDGDGYLDSEDSCPQQSGNSSYILTACLDSDGDSVADVNDVWPNNPYLSLDSDGDGIHDPIDSFPDDGTQWYDNDNDGFGDNPNGNNPDPHLDDTDNDGYSNQFDDFPLDSTQWLDSDNDGLGDNPEGNNPDPSINDSDNDGYTNDIDLFRLDPTQWADSDGDGYGDNPEGIYGDQFPNNPSQCCDRDSDGWGDNFNGTQRDMFPDEPTQWIDIDGDGLGDNPSGINGDPYLGDTDNDGVPNDIDIFPEDPTRTLDNDGDGLAVEDEGEILDNIHETDLPMILASAFICLLLGSIIGGTMAIRIKKE